MTLLNKFVIKALAIVTMLLISISSITAQGDALIRFVHVIPDAVPVDVYVNGTLTVRNLNYGEASTYINVPAGTHTVTATASGLQATLWEQSVSINADSSTTFIASDAMLGQFDAFSDNLDVTNFGTSRLAIIHALAGGENVAVQLAEPVELGGATQDTGTAIAPEIAYGEKFGEFDLPSQTYVVDVLPVGASDALIESVALSLASNTSYMAVVYGTASNPQALLLSAPTSPAEDTGLVRVVHGIVDGSTVDVLVNDTLIVPGLTIDNPTEHIALPAGEHELVFVVSGTDEEVADIDIEIEADTAQTLIALLVDGDVELVSFADDISSVDEVTASASVINAIDGASVSVELSDGTEIAEDGATSFAPILAGTSFTLNLDGDEATISGDDVAFYGGVYYNIIVLDGSAFGAPSLLVLPTSLAQTLASAPGAGEALLVTGDPAPPTEAPAEVEVVVTEAPAVSQPVTVAPEDVVLGEIALDPSANLNLRQYPNANALVLGQAPSGASLIIDGREGAPVALVEGQAPPPEADDFVDPVLELGDGQDLDPTTTWVRVIYNTPDGGQITAWVLSQYLIITDNEGLFDLRDLEMFPANIAGEALNTDISSPTEPEDIVSAEVINIDSSANLNIRRSPDVSGEVLGQLNLGTVLELNGLLASTTGLLPDSEWAFVSYTPAEGGVISGWVSTGFLTYQWNGNDTDLIELVDRGLIDEIDADTVGQITAGTAPVVAATPDPEVDAYVAEILLDPDANLNLRRTPSVDGEVLVQIPSGAFVIVTARTSDGDWLQTSYEGEDGWIASQFVVITFNGDFVSDVFEIPVDSDVSGTDNTTNDAESTEEAGN